MTQRLTQTEVIALLEAMLKLKKDAEIDWSNGTIRILSEVKVDETKILSTGPAKYQDILFSLDRNV